MQDNGAIHAVLCSKDGNLTLWANLTSESEQMLTHHFAGGNVVALEAALVSGLFVIVAALDNGVLHCASGASVPDDASHVLGLTSRTLQPGLPQQQVSTAQVSNLKMSFCLA